VIEVRDLHIELGERRVLDGVSFNVARGEIVFVLGKSGVGKSVLLKNIVGLMRPDRGEIRVDGTRVTDLEERDLFAVRRRCAMVFQNPALLDGLTAFDNIAFGLRAFRETDESEIPQRVEEAIEWVGLSPGVLNQRPPELSFGMQKRVSIARAVAVRPNYLLFDEPTTGLDPVSTSGINALIEKFSEELSVTALVVSHDMKSALALADRILFLDGGKVIIEGTPDELRRSSLPLVRDFLSLTREETP